MVRSCRQSAISIGMVPVRLAEEMINVWRDWKEERFDGKGICKETDWILISVTKPCGEQVMKVQLHGVESWLFQEEKEGD